MFGVEVEYTEDTLTLQIEQTDQMKDYMERVRRASFYLKMDFLCRSRIFNDLNMINVELLAREVVHFKKKLGDTVFKRGAVSPGIFIVLKGQATLVYHSEEKEELQGVGSQVTTHADWG